MVFIIRDNSTLSRPEADQKIIKADQFWAYRQAEEAIADGFRQRDEIIASAQAAYEAEQRRGYADGREIAKREQAGNMVEIVCHTVEYFAKVERQMVDLVLDAVRRIIGDFNERDRVYAVVRHALSLVRTQKHLVLRVHPDQIEAVRGRLAELLVEFPAIEYIDVTGDARLAADACAIESDIGVVEANISNQIEVLRDSFTKVLGTQN